METAEIKSLLFSFRGRINRGKWWLALLIFIIYGILVSTVVGGILYSAFSGGFGVGAIVGIAIIAVAWLAALVAGIAVGVKRLHDRNKSGWWVLLFYVVPGITSAIGQRLGDESPAGLLLAVITLALYIWGFVELGCLRGTVGPNKYGPDPLATDDMQPAAVG